MTFTGTQTLQNATRTAPERLAGEAGEAASALGRVAELLGAAE